MDRRQLFTAFLERKAAERELKGQSPEMLSEKPNPPSSGLDPYTGPWTFDEAAHLLRRAMFGPTKEQIQQVADMGMDAAVAQLLADTPMPDLPVNVFYEEDEFVPIGESWVYAPCPNFSIYNYRRQILQSWMLDQIFSEGISAREKMSLFWHNHFAVEMLVVANATFMLFYYNTLRENAFGNFRELTKKITVDPAMLRYLNGNQSTKNAPNENYARELLELFTVGKGELIGPGDYSNYTEEDIRQIARVLTGWRDRGYRTGDPTVMVESYYQANRHDTGTKQLSYHFDHAVISNAEEDEYKILIDIIFQKDTAAHFIARKLYRWFIYYDIDETIENEVIAPLAQIIYQNDYEIKPALEALFKSEHFYDVYSRGSLIKNPVDFVFSTIKPLQVQVPDDPLERHVAFFTLRGVLQLMQMEILYPPSVAGWQAYYQAPGFHRLWTNSVTLPLRNSYSDAVSFAMESWSMLEFISTFENPVDINALISELVSIFLPRGLTEFQRDYLKEFVLQGLPDFEWTDEYGMYLSDPGNEELANALETKLRSMLSKLFALAEFQVC